MPTLTPAETLKLASVAERLGADPIALSNLINFESGWNHKAKNPRSGAIGVIQWMPATAAGMGTTTAKIAAMSRLEQLDLVERYLGRWRGRLDTPQRLYLSVFYPAARDWPPAQFFPEKVRKANPGINTPADYVAKVERRAGLSTPPPPPGALPSAPRRSGSPWLLLGGASVLLLGLALVLRSRP